MSCFKCCFKPAVLDQKPAVQVEAFKEPVDTVCKPVIGDGGNGFDKGDESPTLHHEYHDARDESVSDIESVTPRNHDAIAEVVAASTVSDYKKEKPRPCIDWVIGLDFGTTYSGFAYASRTSGNPAIQVYYDWPRKNNETPYCKTLTGLYYLEREDNSGQLQCVSWGYPARKDYAADDHGNAQGSQAHYLTKFKLLLNRDSSKNPALKASIPPQLTVNKVITDYLRLLGEHALSVIENHEMDFRRDAVQWCVTVPSIWDENAMQQMKACMVNAGLVSANAGGIEAVKVVLEPEAASFHCHQILLEKRRDVSLNAKDKILVADVGGGTVDIVVQELIGSGDEYKVKELTESSGGLCGGTFVDESFMRFLSTKVRCLDEFLCKEYPSYKARLLKDWEDIKMIFDDAATDTMDIYLHPKLASKWEAYEKQHGRVLRDSSTVELTRQDMKAIFDPVVDKVLDLIAAQLTQVPDVKVMFVVGGFAGSPYLMQRIRDRFRDDVQHIVSPPSPGSAIVQGAVSLTLHPDAIVSRISKKT